MDATEAREHLEMVDRILAEAQPARPYRLYSRLLIAFGAAAAALDSGIQLQITGHGAALTLTGIVLMLACWAYLIWCSIAARREAVRMPLSQARLGSTMRAVWLAVFIASFAQPHVFSDWAAGAIWSLGAAIQMLVVGFSGDRRATVAGLVFAASIVAANSLTAIAGFVLAAGFVLGYMVPGVLYILDKDDCADCG